MCGISAIVQLTKKHQYPNGSSVDNVDVETDRLREEMLESLDMIQHRGPDSNGVWVSSDHGIALGHVRLSINDLSPSGYQPLHSADGAIHAIVMGELYGYEDIKAKLVKERNCQFSGNSDSEIVIALYKAYGLDLFQHLRGEFAFCLYDSRENVFIAARDRYGIKPLFWTIQNDRLLLAAEIKAFLPLGWDPEWDVQSLLEAGWNFDDRTLFKDVKKVRPGHYLVCNAKGEISHHRYWDTEYPDKRVREVRNEKEIIEGVREHLIEAVRIRLRADVPIGVYLSGGIDSSVIAGLVTHLVKEQGSRMGSLPASDRVSCFSVAFEKDSGFNESDIAERTANFLDVKLHRQYMDEAAMALRFEDATWHCEHHNPDLNFVGKFALSELPRKRGFKVVLTGEGADEIFTGYPVYLPDVLREPDTAWDSGLSEMERTSLQKMAQEEIRSFYRSIGANGTHDTTVGRMKLNDISTVDSMAAFLPPVFAEETSQLEPRKIQDVIADDVSPEVLEKIQKKWHPVNSAQYVWTKGHLANQFLSCLGDRTEMAHSVEGRTPFLDHHLTAFVNNAPPSLKMKWMGGGDFTEKYILREAMKPFVTKEIYERAKHPYSAPFTYPSNGPLHQKLESLLTKENVQRLGFVSWNKTSTLLERAFEHQEAMALRLAFVVAQWIVISKRFGVKTASYS